MKYLKYLEEEKKLPKWYIPIEPIFKLMKDVLGFKDHDYEIFNDQEFLAPLGRALVQTF